MRGQPMSSDGVLDDDVPPTAQELVLAALRAFSKRSGRAYLTWPDVLRVLGDLGYPLSPGPGTLFADGFDFPDARGPFPGGRGR